MTDDGRARRSNSGVRTANRPPLAGSLASRTIGAANGVDSGSQANRLTSDDRRALRLHLRPPTSNRRKCPGLGGLGGTPTQAVGASFWPRQEPKISWSKGSVRRCEARREKKMVCRKLLQARPSHPPTRQETPNFLPFTTCD